MTRLHVRAAEFDGAVRLAVAHGMTEDRARAAAELLYRVDRRSAVRENVPAAVIGGQRSGRVGTNGVVPEVLAPRGISGAASLPSSGGRCAQPSARRDPSSLPN